LGFKELVEALTEALSRAKRIVVLGVGSSLRGDDAAGSLLARRLSRARVSGVLVLDCATTPESFTDKVGEFGADHVVIVDAVEAGLRPGEVVVVTPSELAGATFDTHHPSLKLLAAYLERALGVKVLIVGVQVKKVELTVEEELSSEVEEAVGVVEEAFKEVFRRLGRLEDGAFETRASKTSRGV